MDRLEHIKKLVLEISPNFREEDITLETNLMKDLMFDSISVIQLIVAIEETFDIEFNDDLLTMDNIMTIEKILCVLEQSAKT